MEWTHGKPNPAQRIDLEAKSDRELLIQSVMMINHACVKIEHVDRRVDSLENWRAYLTGAIVVLSAIVTMVGAWALGKI